MLIVTALVSVLYSGSTSVAPVVSDLVRAKVLTGTVEATDSRNGLRCLEKGTCEIAMVSREPDSAEKARFRWVLVGYEALSVVVPASSGRTQLSIDEVRAAFTGGDARFNPYTREPGSGTRKTLEDALGITITPAAREVQSSREMDDAVAGDTKAIGFVSHGIAMSDQRLTELKVSGVAITAEAVRSGKYPFRQPLYLVARSADTAAELRGKLGGMLARTVLTRNSVIVP